MKKYISILAVIVALFSITISASDVSVASLNSSCATDGVSDRFALGYQNTGSGASIYAETTFTGCNEAMISDVFHISAQASCYYYYNSAPYTYYSFTSEAGENPEGGFRVTSGDDLWGGMYLKTVGNIYESYCAVCKMGEDGNQPGSII